MNSPFWSLVMRYFLEFFSMVPCAVLCFLPVQDRLRIKPLNIFLTGIPLSILWAFAGGLVCADFGIPRDFWILPSFILFAVFFHRVVEPRGLGVQDARTGYHNVTRADFVLRTADIEASGSG